MLTSLPQLSGDHVFLTDGGLETSMIFQRGLDLLLFASYKLLEDDQGRAALRDYFARYLEVARERGAGFILDTATWRSNPDWGARLGDDAAALDAVNRAAVELALEIRDQHGPTATPVLVNGVVGPRGDGYVVEDAMTAADAEAYHAAQVRSFAAAGADMVSAITMTYAEEAIGIARAAAAAGMPVAISFTVETDGRLPSGQALSEAIEQVDAATGGSVAYYMVNCAHPSHFDHVLAGRGGSSSGAPASGAAPQPSESAAAAAATSARLNQRTSSTSSSRAAGSPARQGASKPSMSEEGNGHGCDAT